MNNKMMNKKMNNKKIKNNKINNKYYNILIKKQIIYLINLKKKIKKKNKKNLIIQNFSNENHYSIYDIFCKSNSNIE